MSNRSTLIAVLLFLSMLLASPGQAKIIWVAPNGTGNGTEQNPYGDLQSATYFAVAGDTIYLRGGRYYVTKDQWVGQNSGTASQPITIQSAPNEWAIIDARNVAHLARA